MQFYFGGIRNSFFIEKFSCQEFRIEKVRMENNVYVQWIFVLDKWYNGFYLCIRVGQKYEYQGGFQELSEEFLMKLRFFLRCIQFCTLVGDVNIFSRCILFLTKLIFCFLGSKRFPICDLLCNKKHTFYCRPCEKGRNVQRGFF